MNLSGEIAALLAACCWSGSSMSFTSAIRRVGSVNVNVTRMFFAAFYLLITILFFNLPINLTATQMWLLILSGFCGLVFGDTYLFQAFDLIGARFTMLITCTVPAMNSLFAYLFLNETLSIINISGIVITIFGIFMVVLEEKSSDDVIPHEIAKGIFYAFLASIGHAVGLLLAKIAFAFGDINFFVATEIRIFSSAILLLPIMVALKKYKNPIKTFSENKPALYFTMFASFIGPFLGITLSMIAIANTKLGIASTLMATSPLILLPLGHLIHHEKFSIKTILGTLIAVGGVAILFLV
ncbi:MAG: DMT family transporter [Bacteroidetes bacterium]|nr:DMT family transporter [Bacteroidota bacterium]